MILCQKFRVLHENYVDAENNLKIGDESLNSFANTVKEFIDQNSTQKNHKKSSHNQTFNLVIDALLPNQASSARKSSYKRRMR